jgi:hypothetical protein
VTLDQAVGHIGFARGAVVGRCGADEHAQRLRQKAGPKQKYSQTTKLLWHYILSGNHELNKINALSRRVTRKVTIYDVRLQTWVRARPTNPRRRIPCDIFSRFTVHFSKIS